MEVGNLIKDLMIGAVLLLLVGVALTPYFNPAHEGNNLCENKWTKAYYGSGRSDHGETGADGKDCCFNRGTEEFGVEVFGSSKEWCEALVKACKESDECETGDVDLENCRETPKKGKTYFLFDCAESTMFCDNESCVMNCNHDGECQKGEYKLCPDCY